MSEIVIDNDLLISLVEARPVLWDKSLDIFKDRDATRNAWREACVEIRKDFNELEDEEKNAIGKEVLKRWKNVRDAFVKAEKKRKESQASGSKATKKRKYIFGEELKFLNKIYTERETADSDNVDNEGDKTDEHLEVPTVSKETVSKSPPKSRKRKKLDEIDLKILKTLDKPEEQPNSQMSFFQSLMPYVQTFNHNEMLEFQMGVLQLISNIKSKHTPVALNREFSIQHPVHYQHHNQPTPINYHNEPQQLFISPTTSFNQQYQTYPHRAASSTPITSQNLTQRPFISQNTSFPPIQASSLTNIMSNPTSISTLPAQLQSNKLTPMQSTSEQEKKINKNSAAQHYENFLQLSSDECTESNCSVNSTSSSMMYDFA